jgi:hypothetical protein
MLCVLCHDNITGYGNNAEPVVEGKCCDSCNFSVVLQQRLRHAMLSHSTEPSGSAAPSDERNGPHDQKEPHRRPGAGRRVPTVHRP